MKRASLFLVFLAAFSFTFSADLVTQRIGLVIDKQSPNYNLDLIMKKVILSTAADDKNLILVSGDKVDLESSGVSELNGTILMKCVSQKRGTYRIELYQMDRGLTPIDDSTTLSLRDFGNTVDDVALKVVRVLEKKFPPRPVQELARIDVRKIKLSEYESQFGFWSVSLIPAYNMSRADVSADVYSNSVHVQDSGQQLIDSLPGFSVSAEGLYRIQQWYFLVGCSAGYTEALKGGSLSYNRDYMAYGRVGYGIFGSVLILGLEPAFYYGEYFTDRQSYLGFAGMTAYAPGVTLQHFFLNLFVHINISKDYSFVISGAPPIPYPLNGMWLTYSSNLNNWTGAFVPMDKFDGMPLLKLELNFRIFRGLRILVQYDSFEQGAYFDSGSLDPTRKPVRVYSDGLLEMFVQNIKYQKTRIGLGLQYEF